MRTDPFGELSRLTQRHFGEVGSWSKPVVPMDAYRSGETFVVQLDLPGMDPASIDLSVDRMAPSPARVDPSLGATTERCGPLGAGCGNVSRDGQAVPL
jgi:hypothetical protein